MSDVRSAYFRRLYEHERDSHAKILGALEAVPAERRSAPEFTRAVDLLAHVVAARRMWLGRLGVTPPYTGRLEPANARLEELRGELAEVERLWTRHLAALSDAELGRSFEYQSLDSGRFRNSIEEVLTQLHGHALYHRGQISLHIRALGGTPPTTDFIVWARVAVG